MALFVHPLPREAHSPWASGEGHAPLRGAGREVEACCPRNISVAALQNACGHRCSAGSVVGTPPRTCPRRSLPTPLADPAWPPVMAASRRARPRSRPRCGPLRRPVWSVGAHGASGSAARLVGRRGSMSLVPGPAIPGQRTGQAEFLLRAWPCTVFLRVHTVSPAQLPGSDLSRIAFRKEAGEAMHFPCVEILGLVLRNIHLGSKAKDRL